MENQEYQSSLLLSLTSKNNVREAQITECPEKEFPIFIDYFLHGTDLRKTIPNELLIRIDFKNRDDIPKIDESFPCLDLAKLLIDQSGRGGIKITSIPLHDAWICEQAKLDPLDPKNSHIQLKDSLIISPLFMGSDCNFIGIRTDLGLHLFSSDSQGGQAIEDCLQYYANHFFDKQKATDHLDIVTVRVIGGDPEFTGNKFISLEDLAIPPLDLPSDCFYQNKAILEIPENKFDMLPTLDNFCRLITQNGVSEFLTTSGSIYDFTSLIRLHDGSCDRPEKLDPEFFQLFSFEDRFYDLTDELDDCDDAAERAEVGQRIRERAGEIMEKEFPDLHFCRDPKVIEAELQQAPQFEEPIISACKGPKM